MPTPPTSSSLWHDWTLKIVAELATISNNQKRLEDKLEALEKSVNITLTQMNESLDKLNDLLTGGKSPEDGLILKVDRLREDNKRKTWLIKTAIAASIGAIVTTISEFIFNKK